MSEPFLGEIRLFGFNYAPNGWAFCQGQLLPIAQNSALFALLGTMYGGNGQTTFALPDFRGRVPVGMGQGPGLPSYTQGEMSGEVSHTLIISEMPSHNHLVSPSQSAGTANPAGAFPGSDQRTPLNIYNATADGPTMNPQVVGQTGGSQPHNNMQPYLAMNYCIALNGIFPPRS
jgi:microcystin-dependent protein